jgi:hypothetical protein
MCVAVAGTTYTDLGPHDFDSFPLTSVPSSSDAQGQERCVKL